MTDSSVAETDKKYCQRCGVETDNDLCEKCLYEVCFEIEECLIRYVKHVNQKGIGREKEVEQNGS